MIKLLRCEHWHDKQLTTVDDFFCASDSTPLSFDAHYQYRLSPCAVANLGALEVMQVKNAQIPAKKVASSFASSTARRSVGVESQLRREALSALSAQAGYLLASSNLV